MSKDLSAQSKHDKNTDFLAGRPYHSHNYSLFSHSCCNHLPLTHIVPFPPIPLILENLSRLLCLPSALAVSQMWEYPWSSFYFSPGFPGILEKMELCDVSFIEEQYLVSLLSKAWESFRSVRWFAEMPSSQEAVMLAAFTSEISLHVTIWPKPLVFGMLFSSLLLLIHFVTRLLLKAILMLKRKVYLIQ